MNNINIALVGLGQIGNYLMNELNKKKKDIELKTGKRINILAISTSEIKLSVIIDENNTLKAIKKLHTIFDLD